MDSSKSVQPVGQRSFLMAVWLFFEAWAIPGMGMFCESYFIFSIGNISPLLTVDYPTCYKTFAHCSKNFTYAETYIQIAGIMAGMLSLGYLGDQIGRKWGSVTTASVMLIGGIMLTASSGVTVKGAAIMFTVSQAIFGYGVGGEYPMAAASASEQAESSPALRNRRGQVVINAFTGQGWGNFINTIVLVLLLAIFNQQNPPLVKGKFKYDVNRIDTIWRLSFGLGLIPVVFMIFYRVFRLKESKVWGKEHTSDYDATKVVFLMKYYWHRVLGAGGAWFFWDVAFYGNKLFQSTFISIIIGKNSSISTNLQWTLLNSAIALVGYYAAALVIDKPWMGRTRLQNLGFAMISVLFLFCSIFYNTLIKPQNVHWFQFLYFLSSFFGQFGPNCTTWLLAGEIFPTDVRTTAHGLSAFMGKCGALLAGILFHYISNVAKFWWCFATCAAGLVLSILFVPDLTGMDLSEGDMRWKHISEGNHLAYTGEAIHPTKLSLFERLTGLGNHHDAAADQKVRQSAAQESVA